ncbi:putative oxidoreductase, short chain dehydrogenase/reductase family [Penicillium brasilianum]|uniref:Putative oxidoreductase, short chain dehydrogenase/reductase family n=1 Tax=Penicillium brasilianum TaxID=104259 RepID=A0A1S9RG78_PENBI|nr:putative oxidoreductase, short chain dehydrogenase/reductase family [Penicillium brasilianum]
MASLELDVDAELKAFSFTRRAHRDVYPSIDPRRPELSQAGKVIVVTGASRGIGKLGFAASFAQANAAAVVLIGRSAGDLAETEKLVNSINPDIQILSIPLDVTDTAGVTKAFEDIVARFGAPHVLINNAGYINPLDSIADADVDLWWRTQEVNVKGTFLMSKAYLKAVKDAPVADRTIINVTSLAAQGFPPGMSSYSPAKLALCKFTAYLAQENPDITAVSLDPGLVPTDMGHSVPYLAQFLHDTPELSGGIAVWLATGDKRFLTARYVAANWNVEELESRKEEIMDGNFLTFGLKGKFGISGVVVEGRKH